MYRLPPSDYTLADIERFCQLTLRRGSMLVSVKKTPEDMRVVLGAWLLGLPAEFSRTEALESAKEFLSEEGAWLSEIPEAILGASIEEGLLEVLDFGERFTQRQEVRPGINRHRLIDEIETAQSIMAERRARVREELQAKNRAVNAAPVPEINLEADERFMRLAFEEARAAQARGEVPIGAVLVKDDEVIASAGNQTRGDCDPTAHAEVLVLREGAKKAGNYRLDEATLYVTLEPCPMCAGAIIQARVGRVVFASSDPKMGAMGGALDLAEVEGVNHRARISCGCCQDEAQGLLRQFFDEKRQKNA